MFSHQHFANTHPTDFERVPKHLTGMCQGGVDAEALLRPSTPSKAETKPVLLTNRFICILTGAQILDTDFFCTTVQEPVQNMLFFYSCTKKPKNQQTKRQRVWQYLLTTGTPQPPIDPPPLALARHADFVVSIACLERLHCQ